jgi:hypothetical protein
MNANFRPQPKRRISWAWLADAMILRFVVFNEERKNVDSYKASTLNAVEAAPSSGGLMLVGCNASTRTCPSEAQARLATAQLYARGRPSERLFKAGIYVSPPMVTIRH